MQILVGLPISCQLRIEVITLGSDPSEGGALPSSPANFKCSRGSNRLGVPLLRRFMWVQILPAVPFYFV